MDIQGPFKPNKKQGNIKQTSDVDGITLTHLGQSIDVDPKKSKRPVRKPHDKPMT